VTEARRPDRRVRLRPIARGELPELGRLMWDPTATGEHQWFGFRLRDAREIERRWNEDGLVGHRSSYLAIEVGEREVDERRGSQGEIGEGQGGDDELGRGGVCAGWVNWRPIGRFGNLEIGIVLFPEHRGQGIGTEAQRLLVEYLFGSTTAHRLQAGTEVDNITEQRALERVGFRREGVARGLYFRAGQWRDSVLYGLLRDDPR
jgi:[ribosomal protein S5]-alanine N-acetyltransferase